MHAAHLELARDELRADRSSMPYHRGMQCSACGQAVSVEGVFPGGTVTCACGASAVVPLVSPSSLPAPSYPPPSVTHAGDGAPTCPRCQAVLVLRDEGGVVVTACPSEHGLFIGHTALDELTKHAPPAAAAALDAGATLPLPTPPAVAAGPLHCPRCGEPMIARTFARGSTIVVDECPQHGTWFDAGELRAASLARVAPARDEPHEGAGLATQAGATLDVALALDQAREEETVRRAVDLADDVLDTFNWAVLGRSRPGSTRYR